MRVVALDVTVVEVPQRPPIAPYRSHLRTSSTTQSGIVRIATDEGLVGWGEFNVNFLPDLSARAMQARARELVLGRDPTNLAAFRRDVPLETRLKSGVEMALWDVTAQAAGLPLCLLLGGRLRDEIELAACLGIVPRERAAEVAAQYVEEGFTTIKTKAGLGLESDLDIVRGIRDGAGSRLEIRIDPNRAYSLADATDLARRLEEFDLQYLEQPIMAEPLSEARILRAATRTPIALNESVTDPASAWDILRQEAAMCLLPDTHCAGGIAPCVEIGALCAAAGVPCVMHCGHDLGPKTAAMLHVAAACPAYCWANDSTYYGLVEDVTVEPLVVRRGRIAVPTRPGLGVACDPEKLAKYALDC